MAATHAPAPIVGIDLGTTNSLVAVCDERGPRVLPVDGASPMLPSVVRYSADGSIEAIGREARAAAAMFPGRTIQSAKRLMGRSRRDAEPDLPLLPYEVIEGDGATARVRLPAPPGQPADAGRIVSPQEVSAAILRALRERASAALGVPVARAVVTVPAYFDDAQRQATRDAARLAGLEAVRIVNEPTAAALAYGIGLRSRQAETIAVYDLGGGTFDISILRVIPGADVGEGGPADADAAPVAADFFRVLSTAGDTRLGGDDADRIIIDRVLAEVFPAGAPALPPAVSQRLRDEAERVKIALGELEEAEFRIPAADGMPELVRPIARREMNDWLTPWVERTLVCCGRALRDAKLKTAQVDRVVMVGGSTRVPLVRDMVRIFFGREPYTALNPDEVVALGAAVQASVLSGGTTGMLLLDVIPLSLGIETAGGAVAKLIVRNSTIPARATEMFSTSVDGQTSIKLHVLQGEREMAPDCRSLGVFHLRGLPPMPAGIPQLEVEFLVDASGVLSVSAHERRSGKRAAIQVAPHHGLTRDEVDRMEAESFAHARDDMARHRIADLIVNSRLDVKWIRAGLVRVGEALDPAYRDELVRGADELEAMAARAEADWRAVDPNTFHRAKEQLDQRSVRMQELSIAQSLRDEQGAKGAG